jgi:hypothetical protein
MMYGGDAYGTASYGEAGTAASASRKGGVVAVELYTRGRGIRSGPPAAAFGRVDGAPPPAAAERLLRWVLPLKVQEPVLGDLAEMHAETSAKFGMREARRLYWWHAVRSIAPVALRWSIVATAVEWVRRTFGG